MGDKSSIEWTDATLFGEPLPRRCSRCRDVKPITEFNVDRSRPDGRGFVCRACLRVSPIDVPNRIERAAARLLGKAWCLPCRAWHPLSAVHGGLCTPHQRADARRRYATDENFRGKRLDHALRNKRGVERVPPIGRDYLIEEFDGCCAYCERPAETWDHVEPISEGGKTTPDNIVPACKSCNSSKKNGDVWVWLEATGRRPHEQFIARAATYKWGL